MRPKWFHKYLCPNILVDFERTVHITRKKNICTVFSDEHRYVLPRGTRLPGTPSGIRPWHWTGNPRPRFLPRRTTRYCLRYRQQPGFTKVRHHWREGRVPVVKLNYLERVVHTVSDRCRELMYFPQPLKVFSGTLSNSLQCPGCLGSRSGNQNAKQPFQSRLFCAAVSQRQGSDITDTEQWQNCYHGVLTTFLFNFQYLIVHPGLVMSYGHQINSAVKVLRTHR